LLARTGSTKDATLRYGISRIKLYQLIKQHPQIAKRLGSLTLIDFAVMDALIESLPTTAEAPSVHRPNLVNLAGGKGKSKTVLAAHKRRAAERAAKAEAAAKA
jgi:hypothetical protein